MVGTYYSFHHERKADLILAISSVKPKSTWSMVKPQFENLVSSYVFPQLCFSPAKQEQWQADPIEFVRGSVGSSASTYTLFFDTNLRQVDEYESYDTPVASATTFLLSLASNRTKVAFMPILTFINRVLQTYVSAYRSLFYLYFYAGLSSQETCRTTALWCTEHDCRSWSVPHAPPGG